METKYKVLIGSVALVSAFAVGRFTTPVKIKTETKIVEVKTKVKDTEVKKKKTKVVVTQPDGSKTETTVTETDKQQKEVTDSNKNTDSKSTETKGSDSKLLIYGIVGIDFRLNQPTYGLGVYKPILGPFGIGVFGLTSNIFGVTIGLSI